MKTYSQAYQDLFAQEICGSRSTYIEIGAHQPKKHSNTYNLEVVYEWLGFGIELNTKFKDVWSTSPERKNKIYWDNALTFDYKAAVTENNFSNHINYLSCDIEPPENTFLALKRVIESGITFDCITFEHDSYSNKTGIDYNKLAINFLKDYGYKVAVYDVWCKRKFGNVLFETWFVRDEIKFKEQSFDDWLISMQGK